MSRSIKPSAVQDRLRSATEETVLLDVRERGTYAKGHLLFAASAPLSRLERDIDRLVPRRATPVVVIDNGGGDGRAAMAAERLGGFGYSDIHVLANGMAGWAAAGEEVFDGVYVPSKAFGEYVEEHCDTPRISADELMALKADGTDLVILDSRPPKEYFRMTIPGAINVPGGELVHRVHDLASDPNTLVVVNCAGRTRSIIGAQSLINAGVPNRVVALKNGTMGWTLAGHTLEHEQTRAAPPPSEGGRTWARSAAANVALAYEVPHIDSATLERFRAEAEDHTLYICDVRTIEEYITGHVPGARHTPGGQLVQATDSYVPVINARVVICDDDGVRATMAASWLRQLGRRNIFVLDEEPVGELGPEITTVLGMPNDRAEREITPTEAAAGAATVIDLADSRRFMAGHIASAWWTVRARLVEAVPALPKSDLIVLTSPDGVIAHLAAPEVARLVNCPVRVIAGGTNAWVEAGLALVAGTDQMVGERDDVHLLPYDHPTDEIEAAMHAYLDWETALVPRVTRDAVARFDVTRIE
jgi:rhodanese-related sulfurtransferase